MLVPYDKTIYTPNIDIDMPNSSLGKESPIAKLIEYNIISKPPIPKILVLLCILSFFVFSSSKADKLLKRSNKQITKNPIIYTNNDKPNTVPLILI